MDDSISLELSFLFILQRFFQSQLKLGVIVCVYEFILTLHAILSWLLVYKLRAGILGIAFTICIVRLDVFIGVIRIHYLWLFPSNVDGVLWEFFKIFLACGSNALLSTITPSISISTSLM